MAALLVLAACGDDGAAAPTATGLSATTTTAAPATTTASTTTSPPTTAATTTTEATTTVPAPAVGESYEIIVIVGVDDAVTLGERVEQVPVGADVNLRLVSDRAEEYHVHGIDLEQRVPAGTEASFQFTVTEPGRYEVESHRNHDVLVVIEVA
jgi:heme/copper-type cytochrome/quinol oxidase subunit 2